MRFDLTDLRLFLHVQETAPSPPAPGVQHDAGLARARHGRHAGRALAVARPARREPTPAGRTLAHHARLVLAQMDRMRGDLDQYGQGLKGLVRVQCNTTALSEHLPPVLGEFLQRHPRVSVDLEERPSHEIADALRAGTCDIGVLADSADLGGLRVAVFRHDPLCLIVPSGHALAARGVVALADAAGEDFVGLVEGSALEHIAQHARRDGKSLSYRVRLRGFDAVCRMVGQGVGVAVARAAAVRHGRSAGFRRLDLSDDWAARDLVRARRPARLCRGTGGSCPARRAGRYPQRGGAGVGGIGAGLDCPKRRL